MHTVNWVVDDVIIKMIYVQRRAVVWKRCMYRRKHINGTKIAIGHKR